MSEADSAAAKKSFYGTAIIPSHLHDNKYFFTAMFGNRIFLFFGTVIIMNRTCHDSAKRSFIFTAKIRAKSLKTNDFSVYGNKCNILL
jgi:hypothetical protein